MSQKRLWAPWRLTYLSKAVKKPVSGCIFCKKGRSRSDVRDLVLERGEHGFSILNLFPYSNGHLMVVPYRHIGRLEALHAQEWLELWELASRAIRRGERALAPQGYNVGMNLGRAAGAGIPGHLHLHIVPRWVGDTNFMPVLGSTKVMSQSLQSAHQQLRSKVGSRKVRRKKKSK